MEKRGDSGTPPSPAGARYAAAGAPPTDPTAGPGVADAAPRVGARGEASRSAGSRGASPSVAPGGSAPGRQGRVVMLLSNGYSHDPRVRAEAEGLTARGWKVDVVAWDREAEHPSEEELKGVHVHRIRNRGLLAVAPRDLLRLPLVWRAMLRAVVDRWPRGTFDIVHAHDLDTLPAGVRIAGAWDLPLLYDAHEDWPRMVSKDVPGPIVAWFDRLERRHAGRVDHLVYAAPPILPALLERGFRRDHATAILNCKSLPALGARGPPLSSRPSLLYLGALSRTRLVDRFSEIARLVPEYEIVVGGRGPLQQRIEKDAGDVPNLRYLGNVPADDVLPTTARADAVLALYDPEDPNSRVGVPNKLFEAMACGVPLVGCDGTASGSFVSEHAIGVTAPAQPEAIAGAARRLLADAGAARAMGMRGRALAEQEYNWDAQLANLERVCQALLDRGGPEAVRRRRPRSGKGGTSGKAGDATTPGREP